MIKKEDITEIGKFQKTHALKGEMNAILEIDPDYLSDGNPIVVDMDGIYVPFYATGVRTKGATSYLVKLEGIDTVEDAQKFINKSIYGIKKDLLEYFDSPEEEIVFENDLIRYEVGDKSYGALGEIVRIDDSTINALMIVESPKYGEIYIPINDEFIEDIDEARRVILTNVPEGLIDLNEKK